MCARSVRITLTPTGGVSCRERGSHLPSHANEAMEVWPEALRDASMHTCSSHAKSFWPVVSFAVCASCWS